MGAWRVLQAKLIPNNASPIDASAPGSTKYMKPILTLTMNPAIDVSSAVEKVFPEHKLRCGPVRYDPGGGGINVSRAIKRLGGDTLALHCCGGPSGGMLRILLATEGVPQQAIETTGWMRQNVNVLETVTGQQYRFVMPGPVLSEGEWKRALDAVLAVKPPPELLVASGSLPPGVPDDFYARLARLAREQGIRLMIDTAGPALENAVREGVFLIKPSLRELRMLAAGDLDSDAEQERAALQIVGSGQCEAVVVSLGGAGVLLASRAGCERMPSPAVTVRSKVGAGDSMVAGIALAIARGHTVRDAVRFGVAAGAAAVMNPGTELCHRADAERFFAQSG